MFRIEKKQIIFYLLATTIILLLMTCSKPKSSLKIEFISPQNGQSFITEKGAIKIPCEGKIIGQLKPGCNVKVMLLTDTWYDQGNAPIEEDGAWKLNAIYLAGNRHIIKATVLNAENVVLVSDSIIVYKKVKK